MSVRWQTLGIVGVGGLAGFLVEGLRRSGDGRAIVLSPRNSAQAQALAARFDATIAASNQAVLDSADMIIVATPPKVTLDTIRALTWRPGQLLICVAIDVDLPSLRQAAPGATVVRAMPNTAAALGLDAVPLCPAEARAVALLAPLGRVQVLDDEAAFAAATALSVYHLWLYALMDTMVQAATSGGIPRAAAVSLVASLTRAAGAFALDADPATSVRAPLDLHGMAGSMTAQGLAVLDRADAFGPWREAYGVALRRATGGNDPKGK